MTIHFLITSKITKTVKVKKTNLQTVFYFILIIFLSFVRALLLILLIFLKGMRQIFKLNYVNIY